MIRIALLISLLVPLVGCNTAGKQETQQAMRDVLAEGANATPTPPAKAQQTPDSVSKALLPQVTLDTPRGESSSSAPRFDLSVNDVPARPFFMSLVEGTDQNMVVHPDVKGTISLTLKNVTVEDVMGVARDVYGYEYRIGSTGFQVLPRRLQTRIFEVSYLNVVRAGRSKTRVSSGQVTQPSADSTSGGSNSSNSTTTTGNVDVSDISGSEVETQSEADFWSELSVALRAIAGNSDGGNVVVNPQSGIVIVRAMPREIRDIELFLNNTRNSVTRQVILEAKILEVDLNDGFRSGINYTALFEPGTGNTGAVAQTEGGAVFNGANGVGGIGIDNLAGPAGITPFGGIFSLALNLNDFTAFIELLETQGNVQVLSSPRIATVNNQKAVIKVGTDEFFVTAVSSTTVTGTATSTTPEITLTPFFSGIALDVIPQIDENGSVILHIHPTVSDVNEQTKNITVAGQTQSLPLAASSVRESDSIVRAKSGQIIVIGGLMTNESREDVASTPILGDLPFIGSLFKHRRESARKSELVILLKPIVVAGDQTWRDAIKRTSTVFDRFQVTP